MSKGKNVCVHTGHRERMRQRIIKDGGIDNLADHEVIEVLLYYAIKRADTNELAHRMINSFGSFNALLNASMQDIMSNCGVSENTAFLISLMPHLFKRYMQCNADSDVLPNAKQDYFELVKPFLVGKQVEHLYLICLNASFRVIKVDEISQGNARSVQTDMKKLLQIVASSETKYAIIAHNHPSNTITPSRADIVTTQKIKDSFETFGITLLDHFILAGDKCFSFAQNKICGMEY